VVEDHGELIRQIFPREDDDESAEYEGSVAWSSDGELDENESDRVRRDKTNSPERTASIVEDKARTRDMFGQRGCFFRLHSERTALLSTAARG
jgi:hypothetical protein